MDLMISIRRSSGSSAMDFASGASLNSSGVTLLTLASVVWAESITLTSS